MKKYLFFISLFFLSSCNLYKRDSLNPIQYQRIVNSFENTLTNVPRTDDKLRTRDSITSNYIKNEFLKPFEYLKMEDGYVLDYIRDYGYPEISTVFYARPTNMKPFKTWKELSSTLGKNKEISKIDNFIKNFDYLSHLEVEDNEMGYFELIVFDLLHNDFPRNYNNSYIICTHSALKEKLSRMKNVSDSTRNSAYKMNIEPKIIMKDKKVEVYLTIFSNSSGLKREKYIILRSKPHTILYDLFKL